MTSKNNYKKEHKKLNDFTTEPTSVRLNKFLSEAGVCSRREADKLIDAGKVYVDGKIAETGMKVNDRQEICVGKKLINRKQEKVMLAVYKPVGIVCTEERKEKNNIIDFLKYPIRITYVGRLDKDSEGLLLMTNDGDIINRMMRAGNFHEKEYVVTVDQEITEKFLKQMAEGVAILDTVTRPCKVEKVGKYTFRIILTQGLNRQIRRMCGALGYQVKKLKRLRVMNIELGELRPGQYRVVGGEELDDLYALASQSSNLPYREQHGKK